MFTLCEVQISSYRRAAEAAEAEVVRLQGSVASLQEECLRWATMLDSQVRTCSLSFSPSFLFFSRTETVPLDYFPVICIQRSAYCTRAGNC
jgi:hypothetical protein